MVSIPRRGPLRHLGKLGCVRSDPYEPTSTGIGVGRGGAATQNAAHLDLVGAWPSSGLDSLAGWASV